MPEVATKRSKAGWTTVSFGEVVRQVKDKVDPEESGLERYVAGEHMDTDDLRIRRWGEIGDGYLGPAFHMRFKPGYVLYGSRRTYLRKVAVADFEGITANTTYVLESANPKVLLPELLPFIMQTEAFNEHSVRESKGSVNPYVNYSDLAWFEFALPPIEEQRRFAEIGLAIADADDKLFQLEKEARRLLDSLLLELFRPGPDKREAALEAVLDRIIDYRGKSPPKSSNGVPLLTAKNIRDGYIDQEPREYIPASQFDTWMTRGLPQTGDVLFTTEAPLGNVARVPNYKFALGQRTVMLRADGAQMSPQYLYWLMRSPSARREVLARATGTTALGIKQSLLRRITIVLPSLQDQDRASTALNEVEQQLMETISRRDRLRAVRDSFLDEVMG